MQVVLVFSALLVVVFSQSISFGGNNGNNNRRPTSGQPSNNGNRAPPRGGSSNTDTKFFGTGITTGNEGADGGILGAGAGFLLGTALANANNNNNPCGRRKKRQINVPNQANGNDPNKKFFGGLFGGGSSNNGCNCGRRKRQAPGEQDINNKFFGLESLLGFGNNNNNNCGCNCGFSNNNNGFNSNNNNNNFNSFNTRRCECDNSKYFTSNGQVHGACQSSDGGGLWCYTRFRANDGCNDLQRSSRFRDNPWSYQACGGNFGRK